MIHLGPSRKLERISKNPSTLGNHRQRKFSTLHFATRSFNLKEREKKKIEKFGQVAMMELVGAVNFCMGKDPVAYPVELLTKY